MKTVTTHKQSGFSLIELLLALAIGVIVMSGVYAAYQGKVDDAQVTVLAAGIDTLIYKANMAYSSNADYTSGSPAVAITAQTLNDTAGGLPSAFIVNSVASSGFNNYWGGNATLSVSSTNGGSVNDLLVITLDQIPSSVCTEIVALIAPRMYDTNVNNALVGLMPARTSAALGRNSIRVGQVVPLCINATNVLTFRYLKPVNYSLFRSLPATETFLPGPVGADQNTAITANFNRIENAMNARETAQTAIP